MQIFRFYFRAIKPIPLITSLLLYSLGVAIIDYQDLAVDFRAYLLGQSWIILIQLGLIYSIQYFSPSESGIFESNTKPVDADQAIPDRLSIKKGIWWGVLTSFSGAAVIGVLFIRYQLITFTSLSLLVMILMSVILLSTPPLKLHQSGYGEFLSSFWMIFLIPAFAYVLQKGSDLRLLLFVLSPLYFLHLSMQFALELRSYKALPGKKPENFFEHFGWRVGIHTHNLFIIASFLFIAAGYIRGLPKFTLYIGISLLPLAIFQIFQFWRITSGAKPAWNLISLAAYSLFFLDAYFLSYAYWMQ